SKLNATTRTYPLSLHDALPISRPSREGARQPQGKDLGKPPRGSGPSGYDQEPHRVRCVRGSRRYRRPPPHHRHVLGSSQPPERGDRKSTRLNSSHVKISYAVFC